MRALGLELQPNYSLHMVPTPKGVWDLLKSLSRFRAVLPAPRVRSPPDVSRDLQPGSWRPAHPWHALDPPTRNFARQSVSDLKSDTAPTKRPRPASSLEIPAPTPILPPAGPSPIPLQPGPPAAPRPSGRPPGPTSSFEVRCNRNEKSYHREPASMPWRPLTIRLPLRQPSKAGNGPFTS